MVRPPLPTTAPGRFEGMNMDVFGLAAALGEVFFVLLSPGKIAAGSGFLASLAVVEVGCLVVLITLWS